MVASACKIENNKVKLPLFITFVYLGYVLISNVIFVCAYRNTVYLRMKLSTLPLFFLGPPLNVSSANITSKITLNNGIEFGLVNVCWTPTIGNYDLEYYSVGLYLNGTLHESRNLETETSAVFNVPLNTEVYGNITVLSQCRKTSDGVLSDTIMVMSGGK